MTAYESAAKALGAALSSQDAAPVPTRRVTQITPNKPFETVDDDKVQWGELLARFCDLSMDRQIAALKRVSPGNLNGLIDSANQAKKQSKLNAMQAIADLMKEDGVDPQELLSFITNTPETKKQSVKNGSSTGKRNSVIPPQARTRALELASQDFSARKIQQKVKQEHNFEIKMGTIYNYIHQVRKGEL
ncbi:MAG: hypothetical protein WCF45_10565 [Photobacterium halotolerans]